MNDIQRWLDERPHSRGYCVIGKGKRVHLTRYNDESLCGRLFVEGSRYIDAHDEPEMAPCAACWKIMERESAELEKVGNVVGKLKVSEVRGDVRLGSVPGSSTFHALKEVGADGENVPYCSARTKSPMQSWGPAAEQKPEIELCKACSKLVPTGPVAVNGDTEEKAAENTGQAATATHEAEKAPEAAVKETKKAKTSTKAKPGTAVANLATKSVDEIPHIGELLELGAQRVKEAAIQSFEKGRGVAEVQLKVRLNAMDKDGDPDLNARADATKKGAARVYEAVLEGLPEEGEDPDADVIREKIGTIQTDARRAMQTLQVEYVRSLDIEPDPTADDYEEQKAALEVERARFANALEMFPEGSPVEGVPLKWSDRVLDYYEIKGKALRRYTRAEEAKQRRVIEKAKKAELDAAVEAGEISEEEADATLNPEPSPAELKEQADKRAKNAFAKLIKEAATLESEDDKLTRLDEISRMLNELRGEINEAKWSAS
ncbi:hypothetical protein [Streptomyces sp. A1-5]|uniref:hypothetical protein n=1 Tax=Streptomyces sp. A1-5 TaxID=2738410 RepID=UPI001F261D00|nr:hypothetical protein [Streptomyces sp. A1-5]UJB43612.1 hypothetical protein HRD51_24960 [Streptomyces sp. A1-5]